MTPFDQRPFVHLTEDMVPASDLSIVRNVILARASEIDANGYRVPLYPARRPVCPVQVWVALTHIQQHYTPILRRCAPRFGRHSYSFKHEAERAASTYIANGAALLAAIVLEHRVVRESDGPNGFLMIARTTPHHGESPRAALTRLRRATAPREPISPRLRAFVLERDGFRCRRCGATADDGVRLVIDHVVPVALGGATVPENLQTLCEPDNQGKRDRAPHPHDLRPFGGEARA